MNINLKFVTNQKLDKSQFFVLDLCLCLFVLFHFFFIFFVFFFFFFFFWGGGWFCYFWVIYLIKNDLVNFVD